MGANKSERFTAYARPGSREPEFTIRLLDQNGRRVGGASQDDGDAASSRVRSCRTRTLILTMGRPQGVETIEELPGFKVGESGVRSRAGVEEIVTARIDPQTGSMPGRWYGYDAARASSSIPATARRWRRSTRCAASRWSTGSRAAAIWSSRSVPTGRRCATASSAPILPGLPSGQEQVASLEALDTFAGSTKPITPPGTPPVMVTKLEEVEERGGKVLSVMSNLPLVVRGALRLRPGDLDRARRRPEAVFRLARPVAVLGAGPRPETPARRPGRRRQRSWAAGAQFYQYGVSDLSSQLRVALEQFPGVKLIPFGWVAFFIFLYILLIGPGDYFFLKKVLKRMELTWITFPTIVVTVSLVAYYAAYLLKGNDLLVNKVDVVDIDQAAGLVRGNTWISLFSPQNRDYTIRTIPLPLDRDAAAGRAELVGRAGPAAGREPKS